MLYVVFLSGLSGVLGTSLGGLIGIFFGERKEETISIVLTFAAGIMIGITLFDLMPEAHEAGNVFFVTLGVLFGVLFVFFLNLLLNNTLEKHQQKQMKKINIKPHNNRLVLEKQNKNFLSVGIIVLIAISLHNIPEGMAIGSSNSVSSNLSFTLSLLLMLHDIPEGMAVTTPFRASGLNKFLTFLLVVLSGATTILGGVIGVLLGNLGPIFTSFSLSFAAGAMLYVSFFEILPEALQNNKNKFPSMFIILGILAGFIFTNIL